MIPLHRAIQRAINEAICKPDFEAALPPLSDATWARLLAGSADEERERIEFLGDALMYATIGTLLYEQIPQGSPHLYTNLRAVLHSNAVFSRVAEKLDILAVPDMVLRYLSKKDFGEGASAPTFKPYTEVKATADLFETVLGAYYLEKGFGALCNWVISIYRPLIYVAETAFYKCQTLPNGKRARPYTSSDYSMRLEAEEDRKRRRLTKLPVHRNAVPLGPHRTNINRADHSSKSAYKVVTTTSVKTSSGSTGARSVKLKTKVSTPQTKRRVSPIKKRSPHSARKTVAQLKSKAIFIDLTLTSDSSDDESDIPDTRSPSFVDGDNRPPPPSSSPETAAYSFPVLKGDDDEAREEAILENMLMAHVDSDMDLQSESDFEGELTMDLGTDSDYDGSDMDLDSSMVIPSRP